MHIHEKNRSQWWRRPKIYV